MPRTPFAAATGFCLALALALCPSPTATATAAPPQINGMTPVGARRGASAEVAVAGTNLKGNPRLIAPFAFRAATVGFEAGAFRLSLTPDPATPVGVYPVRVQTDDGLSNPFLFAVGQLPQVAEVEDNGTFETAQVVSAPVVIEGQAAANDVDFFRFAGKKGQKVVVDAQCARVGSGVDPALRLSTAARVFVASADDSPGLVTDSRVVAVLPEDTDYVIELSDSRYQGGGRPVYRLVVGEVPVAEEVYPVGGRSGETVGLELRGGTLSGVALASSRLVPTAGVPLAWFRAAGPAGGLDVESLPPLAVGDLPELREPSDASLGPVRAAVPVAFNGRIDPAGDEDRLTLVVAPGQRLRVEVHASDRGSALDGVLRVLNPKGDQLASADDTAPAPPAKPANNKNAVPVSPDPSLDFTVPAGVTELTLALGDLSGRGGVGYPYRLVVTSGVPTFALGLSESQISVPRGGTAAVGVTAVRRGYTGPITVNVVNPPAGLTVRPGRIAAGQAAAVLGLSAAADAAFDVATLDVVGEGQGPDAPAGVRAEKTLVFAQQGAMPTNAMTQAGIPAALSPAEPVSLDTPAGPVEVAHGFGATVAVKVARGNDADGALALTATNPPPGVTVPAGTIAAKAAEGSVTVNTTTDVPLGPFSLAIVAKGKLAGADRTVAAPVVTVEVVRPATLELSTAAVEVKAGTTIELKGKVVRRGAFREPVTVKVNGLPGGLKADPATLPPDASEFTLKLVADAKAAPATAASAVALAFQVNKKDYPESTVPLSVKVLAAP